MRKTEKKVVQSMVIERILGLLLEQNKTQQDLCEAIGISKSTFTQWKYDNIQSYMNYISEIAEFFEVSETYLLSCENYPVTATSLTSVEIDIVERFRRLSSEKQAWLVQTLKYVDNE